MVEKEEEEKREYEILKKHQAGLLKTAMIDQEVPLLDEDSADKKPNMENETIEEVLMVNGSITQTSMMTDINRLDDDTEIVKITTTESNMMQSALLNASMDTENILGVSRDTINPN